MGSKIIFLSKLKVSKKIPHKKKTKEVKPKPNKKVALALWALGSLLLLIIMGKGLSLLTNFYNPLTLEYTQSSHQPWKGQAGFNVVVKSDNLALISIDPQSKRLTIVKVPPDIYMTLSKGFGSWPARSVFDLGQNENPPIGAGLTKSALSDLLGVPVDGFINLSSQKKIEDILVGIRSNPISLIGLAKDIKSDLAGIEIYRLYQKIRLIREDKVKTLDLTNSSISQSELLADSSRVLGLDNIKLDLFVRDNLTDFLFTNFDGSFSVYNATSHPGLASQVAREISNLGGNVIFTSNTTNLSSKSVVISTKDISKELLIRLDQIIPTGCQNKKCEFSDPKVSDSRAQINIIVGEDYYQKKHDRTAPF